MNTYTVTATKGGEERDFLIFAADESAARDWFNDCWASEGWRVVSISEGYG